MFSERITNPCPPTCPKVKKQIQDALAESPSLLGKIFPRKGNDVDSKLILDVISENETKPVTRIAPINHKRIETDIPSIAVEDVVTAKPIQKLITIPAEKIVDRDEEIIDLIEEKELVYEPTIIQERAIVPTEKIIDDDEKKIDLVEEKKLVYEPTIAEERAIPPTEKIIDRDEEKIDLVEEKKLVYEPTVIQERNAVPTERIVDRDEEKIDLVEEKKLVYEPTIIQERNAVPTEKIIDRDEEKIDLVEEKKLVYEPTVIQERNAVPTERIVDRDEEKIDVVEEKKLVYEPTIAEERAIPPTEKIIDRDEEKIDLVEEKKLVYEPTIIEERVAVPTEKIINRDKKIDLVEEEKLAYEPTIIQERAAVPTERIEPEKRMEYDKQKEGITDNEKFIDEEYEKYLPTTSYKINDEEHEPSREEEVMMPLINQTIKEQLARKKIIAKRTLVNSRKLAAPEHACDETCYLIKEQKERIMHKLKERQRIVDHYYLTKDFRYFDEVCTCSLACMMYTLSRDPFVRSIFASLALFAVGLKLCSELDAWEMPSRIS